MPKKTIKLPGTGSTAKAQPNPDITQDELNQMSDYLARANELKTTFNRMLDVQQAHVDNLFKDAENALSNLNTQLLTGNAFSKDFVLANINIFSNSLMRLETICVQNVNANAAMIMKE